MIERLYKKNLMENIEELERRSFPDLIRYCRELMGIKQYACAQYLDIEEPRYKKIELGAFSRPLHEWEISRIERFFDLPSGMLKSKQKLYVTCQHNETREISKGVWNEDNKTSNNSNLCLNSDE